MVALLYTGKLSTCTVNQVIDSESYVLESKFNTSVERFQISNNREVEFLPKTIGDKLPNLKEFRVVKCGLTVVRDHYTKNMQNVKRLSFLGNKITTIEVEAFKDLVRVEDLSLSYNKLQTLDEKLFATMVSLQLLFVHDNRIKFLNPNTFKIFGNIVLESVDLRSNVCIDQTYGSYSHDNLDQLQLDLTMNCTRTAGLQNVDSDSYFRRQKSLNTILNSRN